MARFLTLLFALLLSGVALTASPAGKTAARPVHAGAVSDAQIESTLRAKLAKSKIGKDGLRFKVARGVVTWEGATNVVQHKGSATRMAHAAGATQVINNIQISAAAKDKAAANLKKAHIVQ
jgi:hypothetical protein